MTRKKKLSVVLFAVLLCFILAFSLAACVDDTQPGEDKTHNETVKPFIDEVSKALSNSISADLASGFYAGYAGSVKIGADEYTFDFDANILSKEKEGEEEANNNFRLVVKKGETVLFGLYNDKTNLYLEQGENKYNFENASVMKALRSVLVTNLPNYSELTNLNDIEVMGTDMKYFVESTMPLVFTILCQDPKAEADKNLMVAKNDNVYSLTMDLTNISSLGGMLGVADLDLSFLEGIKVKLDLTVANDAVKTIGVSLKVGETDYAVNVTSKSDGGLFGAVKDDLDAEVPEALKAVEASSVIQTDFAGKINLVKAGESGDVVLKSLDWKLVSKIDLFDLVDKNFMFSQISSDNFFHFQLSHTCNDTCAAYCEENLAAARSATTLDRYKKTSIIDIAWSPSKMDTNNLFVDISLWDLLTNDGLGNILSALTNMDASSMTDTVMMMLSGQLVLNADLDDVVKADNTVARVTGEEGEGGNEAGETAAGGFNLDIMKLFSAIKGLGGIQDNALVVNADGVKNLVTALAGDGALIGKITGAGLVDLLLDTKNGVKAVSFTCDKNSFGHNAQVSEYNTYEKAVKYNMNGNEKLKVLENQDSVTAYGGQKFLGFVGSTIVGSPAMYTESVEMTEGILHVYAKDADGNYILVADKNTALNNYDLETLYGGMKNLYFKYTYVDFNKESQTAYGSIFGFQGLDLNQNATQEVTLLTSFMTGQSFNYVLQKNIGSVLKGVDLPNLESIIPVAADSFVCKIKTQKNYEAGVAKLVKDDVVTEFTKTYQINEELRTNAHAEFEVGVKEYSFPVKVEDNVKKDAYKMMIPGTYTITYTLDEKYNAKFENGTNVVTETIVVEEFKSAKIVPNADLELVTDNNGSMSKVVIGTLIYTLNDGSEARVDLTWGKYYNKIVIEGGEVLEQKYSSLKFNTGGKYTFMLRYDDGVILSWNYTVGAVTKTEMVSNAELKLFDGANETGKTVLFSVKVTYDTGVVKTREYTIADYKEFQFVDALMQSEDGVTLTSTAITIDSATNPFFVYKDEESGTVVGGGIFKLKYNGTTLMSNVIKIGELQSESATANPELSFVILNGASMDIGHPNRVKDKTLVTVAKTYSNDVTVTKEYKKGDVTIIAPEGAKAGIVGDFLTFDKAGTYKFEVTQDGKKYSVDYVVHGVKSVIPKQGEEFGAKTELTLGTNYLGFSPLIILDVVWDNAIGEGTGYTESVSYNLFDHADIITITGPSGVADAFVLEGSNLTINSAGSYTVSVDFQGTTYSYTYTVAEAQA